MFIITIHLFYAFIRDHLSQLSIASGIELLLGGLFDIEHYVSRLPQLRCIVLDASHGEVLSTERVQASNIAHDLRTPLARLRALIEEQHVALSTHGEPPSEEALTLVLAQTDRLVETFSALLRISRIESGARKSEFVSMGLVSLADEAHETFTPVVEDKGQRLAISINQPATIRGDRELLIQLFANLLQNALRYGSPHQTITLSVDGANLSLTDQGDGIPVDERDKVLQPLYQLNSERQGEGYGLGLAMVCTIADLHDAKLDLGEGPGGRGLCVTVRFPNLTDL